MLDKTSIYMLCKRSTIVIAIMLCTFVLQNVIAQTKDECTKDEDFIEKFIESKGYSNSIVFSPSNIKQFWTDNDVSSKNDMIHVLLNTNNKSFKGYESNPLSFQLAHVNETMNCKIEVIAENSDYSFLIFDSNNHEISKSVLEDDFLQYHVSSSLFHLEDTSDFSFKIVFRSSKSDIVSIKRIVLSFTKNDKRAFPDSPGFDLLLKQIDENGLVVGPEASVPNSNVKYLFSEDKTVLYVKIPNELVSERFLVHIFPVNPDDVVDKKITAGFANYDFSPGDNKSIVPKPFGTKSENTIIRIKMPAYPYTTCDFGQYKGTTRFWRIALRKTPPVE